MVNGKSVEREDIPTQVQINMENMRMWTLLGRLRLYKTQADMSINMGKRQPTMIWKEYQAAG